MDLGETFLDALVRAGRVKQISRVLLVGADRFALPKLKALKAKLVCAVTEPSAMPPLVAEGYACVIVPPYAASRTDRLKAALVAAASARHVHVGETVLVAITADGGDSIDTLMHMKIGQGTAEHASLLVATLKTKLPPALLEILVDVAMRIGREGYEGRPVGTLIVVGDSTRVMEQSHPLTLNPFQGYSESERNLFDAHVREAVLAFAMLDGAFVVREDGVVLAAGRHIRVEAPPHHQTLGHGSRHVAAAAITQQTDATAVVVSQSSGKVRVFHGGEPVLEIEPGGRRGSGEQARAGNVSVTTARRLARGRARLPEAGRLAPARPPARPPRGPRPKPKGKPEE